MKITLLHLEIVMHYSRSGTDMVNLSNDVVRRYLAELINEGMIQPRKGGMSSYEVTARAAVWLGAILATPFPVQTWTMPQRNP